VAASDSSGHAGDRAALGSSKESLPDSLRPPKVPLAVGTDKMPGDELEQPADRENGKQDASTAGRTSASEMDSSNQSSREAAIAESKGGDQTDTAKAVTGVSSNQETGHDERTSVLEKNADEESEQMRPEVAEKHYDQEGGGMGTPASQTNGDQESRAPTGNHCADEAGDGSRLGAPQEFDGKKRKREDEEDADGHTGMRLKLDWIVQ